MFHRKKIINDPVYGFISIPGELIYNLISEPEFQRLRRIRQLGLTDLVYPGALHTRFHHALGSMHLMSRTLDSLRRKGHYIYDSEAEAALIAILFHDVGHGPFSHTLEYGLLNGISHESLSRLILEKLDKKYEGALSLALQIFTGRYQRKFLNELVSSQLDLDRLDYLKRDSFFTGVSEGTIGAERIIQMLDIKDDQMVVEEKGIYSIENFLSARRLMYWQVYLHKATISADRMLNNMIQRARDLITAGEEVQIKGPLLRFLSSQPVIADFQNDPSLLEDFVHLDDYDIWAAMKVWSHHEDPVLSDLSLSLLNRKLFRIVIQNEPVSNRKIKELKTLLKKQYTLSNENLKYYHSEGSISNAAYLSEGQTIRIMKKNGEVTEITKAADLPNIMAMSKIVTKHYLCWPKDISLPS